MAKVPANNGKPITKADLTQLKQLAKGNTPTGLIAYKMDRSKSSIYSMASKNNVSLHPTNKPPYNRIKK